MRKSSERYDAVALSKVAQRFVKGGNARGLSSIASGRGGSQISAKVKEASIGKTGDTAGLKACATSPFESLRSARAPPETDRRLFRSRPLRRWARWDPY